MENYNKLVLNASQFSMGILHRKWWYMSKGLAAKQEKIFYKLRVFRY